MNKWKQSTNQEPPQVWPRVPLEVTVHLLLGSLCAKPYADSPEHSAFSRARQEALCRAKRTQGLLGGSYWLLLFSSRLAHWLADGETLKDKVGAGLGNASSATLAACPSGRKGMWWWFKERKWKVPSLLGSFIFQVLW